MGKMKELYEKLLKNNPQRMCEILEEIAEEFDIDVEEYMCHHIISQKIYDKYASHFENFDGTKGPHWDVETIKEKSGIDFDSKKYTCYDFAYVVNMRYSDDGDLMSTENIFKSAKRYLEDNDAPCDDPSTRAYMDGKQRHLRFEKH